MSYIKRHNKVQVCFVVTTQNIFLALLCNLVYCLFELPVVLEICIQAVTVCITWETLAIYCKTMYFHQTEILFFACWFNYFKGQGVKQ